MHSHHTRGCQLLATILGAVSYLSASRRAKTRRTHARSSPHPYQPCHLLCPLSLLCLHASLMTAALPRITHTLLQASYPQLTCLQPGGIGAAAGGGHVELLPLARSAAPSTQKLPALLSLSRLAQHVLGAPLDKSQQTSDWGARPLSAAQVAYAAADVVVLVEITHALLSALPDGARRGLLASLSQPGGAAHHMDGAASGGRRRRGPAARSAGN